MYDLNSALAASDGRMGGRSFSSHSSSSSSSRSYSARTPSTGFSYSVPYYGPSPFGGGGFYVGPAVGVGVGAGSSFFFIMMGFAAFVFVSGFLSDRSEGGVLTATEKTNVLKLQVCLEGYYNDTIFHFIIKGFLIQGSDSTGSGTVRVEGSEATHFAGLRS